MAAGELRAGSQGIVTKVLPKPIGCSLESRHVATDSTCNSGDQPLARRRRVDTDHRERPDTGEALGRKGGWHGLVLRMDDPQFPTGSGSRQIGGNRRDRHAAYPACAVGGQLRRSLRAVGPPFRPLRDGLPPSRQLKRQAPGPSGWPQLPQGAGRSLLPAPLIVEKVAKADSFFTTSALWQSGHSGAGEDWRTSFSNSLPQLAQVYS